MSERFFYDDFACNLVDLTNDQSFAEHAVMKENCDYGKTLDEVQKQDAKLKDADQLFVKGWMQITNILCGCVILGFLIYRHTT